jgi:hypothetical protein
MNKKVSAPRRIRTCFGFASLQKCRCVGDKSFISQLKRIRAHKL